jgi:hypothetical protein
MAVNEVYVRGTQLTIAAPIAANGGVGPKSGDPLIIGSGTSPSFGIACVAETSYTPPSGVATGNIAVKTEGVFTLPVLPQTLPTGGSGVAIHIGDRVYAGPDGTYDATTGVYYGFTLCADPTTGVHYGNSLDALPSGSVAVTIRVRLKNGG